MADKWQKRYISVAKLVSSWSSCLSRKVGAILVKSGKILSTGYNGAPPGVMSCVESGKCFRKGSASGENLNQCIAVHAEQNAISSAARFGVETDGAELYITTKPCNSCLKFCISAGIKKIYYLEDYPDKITDYILEQSKIELIKLEDDE